MSASEVEYAVKDGVATITLARPDRANAIDLSMYGAICERLAQAGADTEVRAILLEARGADFSIGEDFEYLGELEKNQRYGEWSQNYKGWIPVTWHNPKFVVASVRGRAFGIACELALLADVTYASEGASFGHPETRVGMVSHTVWPWLVGPKIAKEYLASGVSMSASVAHSKGLINAAFREEELDEHVHAFVADLATMPAGTPGANKKRINWAFRDVSRILHDDRFYDVDFEWTTAAREVDYAFYNSVANEGVTKAIKARDRKFEDK
ncbi:enoyl-CoA hydratase/isomerase family protein [Paraburkholderia xenovorans LB400]|uniref:Enoyl-CoA hydratase/isomerase n=1 Tax=Paraburkholderia xenovorans (strain LB400) TaxID=266265 RepID=Q13HH3_PARXL|nr:enoyl-CoA hydratase/isomerase family protein [Paraburkholderia xenovorans]ABE36466.1 Putative enoyl-CoA hydratase/isomerase [Paraburkholderia xenovorans LB400]AIP34583.1 enoyl-CoA hydratase/isomerase family protein [Paraburkholderia xenovorans LB400]